MDSAGREDGGAAGAAAAERPTLQGRRGDDDANTRAGIAGTGIACPPLDGALLGTYLDAFVASEFLPAPRTAEHAAGRTG